MLEVDVTSIFYYYVEVYYSLEGRTRKTLLWKNAKPSLPGSLCHCCCYGVAATAIAVVSLPLARHAGAARSNSNNPQETELAEPPNYEQLKSITPPEYHSFLPLLCESIVNKLPPHCPYDHCIRLKEGFKPPFGLLYSLARHELEACKKWIPENLDKGFIQASSFPARAPILFVKKGDRSLRLVVDY